MESILEQLYDTMVLGSREVLRDDPEYRQALAWWESKKDGSPIDQEDGANLRESAWGLLACSAGLSMGLRLGLELSALTAAGDS